MENIPYNHGWPESWAIILEVRSISEERSVSSEDRDFGGLSRDHWHLATVLHGFDPRIYILSNSIRNTPAVPKNISQLLPTQVPDWGINESAESLKATWLGTDTPTLQILNKRYKPHVFAPLGNRPYLESIGIPSSNIHTLDWWDSCNVTLSIPSAASPDDRISTAFKVTCTPCQHTSARGIFDRAATLWSSWAVEQVLEGGDRQGKKVYFAGDTAYRTVMEHEDENEVPVCPAFEEIGERIGPFDLALIPIGIRIFQDVKAKKALAMHWGYVSYFLLSSYALAHSRPSDTRTWVLTTEDVMEPPRLLKKERDLAGVAEEDFDICGLGETRIFL
ncbi:hypothetical protein PHLCEN_2v5218 [Hermanssonia centrifuga]|uniref:Metallo-beta-lactamase domain-containing protein n=1 Tax=Hermanssonia centrifuga TaxID=98765 RepID=A0A2R6P8P8_9APHY|nr:hypothetical protein PHLCEN_2v5218 [Hermanssonia centrifuga]